MKKCTFLLWILAGVLGLTVASVARAEVIYRTVDYSPEVIAGWSRIDFDGDGTNELSFDFYGITTFAIGSGGGALFLTVHASSTTQVLLQDSWVRPLDWGDPISALSDPGQWWRSSYGSTVWMIPLLPWPPRPLTNVPPGSVETLAQSDPVEQPSLGQGVGMPGYGSFFGVRFQSGGEWLYGWVRLGDLNSSFAAWPSVLDYAYETDPEIGIFAGAGIDNDMDGVWDLFDQCPDTPMGEVVNADGCSISQLVPCDAPWKNHGEYVTHVVRAAAQFQQEGLISLAEAQMIVREAAKSDCGKSEARNSRPLQR